MEKEDKPEKIKKHQLKKVDKQENQQKTEENLEKQAKLEIKKEKVKANEMNILVKTELIKKEKTKKIEIKKKQKVKEIIKASVAEKLEDDDNEEKEIQLHTTNHKLFMIVSFAYLIYIRIIHNVILKCVLA